MDPLFLSLFEMARAYLLIGGNLGSRERIQKEAFDELERCCGSVFAWSSLYESAPWGFDHSQHFLNRVVALSTELPPEALLDELLSIEDRFGRERHREGVYQGRTLDLDILYYDDRIIRKEGLKIPHPHIPERRFTLSPLEEVAPDFLDPLRKKRVRTLLEECQDPIGVKVFASGCVTNT